MNPHDESKYPPPPPAYSEQPSVHPPYPTNPPYPVQPPGPGYPADPSYPLAPGTAPQQIHTVTLISPPRNLGSKSEYMTCPHCNVQMWTRIEVQPNMMTHACALILCCFILWPIAWLPYCCDACQSALHYCSNCNAFIGEHSPM